MTNHAIEILGNLRAIEEAASLDDLWRTLATAVSKQNLSIVMVTKGPQISPFSADLAAFSRLSPVQISQLEALTPAVARRIVLRTHEPFLVLKSPPARKIKSPTDWYARLARLISTGAVFVVPLHQEETVACIVAFAGGTGAFDILTRSSLIVLAHAAFSRSQALGTPRNRRNNGVILSARERACLIGAANKLSLVEIGKTLKISPRTVRFHLDNARAKLGVVTRAQAVRKALRQKFIRP
jgi:DNA-binding CsgD family transcriptional regulator